MVLYETICLMTEQKEFSSKKNQRQIGLKPYEPVWATVHKIRKVPGQKDDPYTLKEMFEADERFFCRSFESGTECTESWT